jgi:hypothetical protein
VSVSSPVSEVATRALAVESPFCWLNGMNIGIFKILRGKVKGTEGNTGLRVWASRFESLPTP